MATAKRTSVRRTRTSARARTNAKPHANSRTKPLPRPHGNRLVFSPALIADGKRRYETTPESLDSIALDFSASRATLKNIARRENWVRYVPPPRGLSRAAEIAAEAEALEAEVLEAEAVHDRHPEVRGLLAEPRRIDARAVALRGSLTLAPQGDGEGAAEGNGAWSMRERIESLRAGVDEQIAAVRALRANMKGVPHSPETAGRISHTLANLIASLERLHRLEIGASQHNGQNSYADNVSDIPADADAFRDELARRIDAFIASRANAADAGDGAAQPADAAP
jgi:hypothetical protein